MSHFYGTLQGTRGKATRCGSRTSGMVSHTASYEGAIRVELYEYDGVDHALVEIVRWEGSLGATKILYDGPVFIRPELKKLEAT